MDEQKAPTYDQVSAGPVYVVLCGTNIQHPNSSENAKVDILPWIDESGERCQQATDLLQMMRDVGPREALELLRRQWFQQQGRPFQSNAMLNYRDLLGAESVSIYDGSYEVYLQRMVGWAPEREYIAPEWQDPRGQNYKLKNSIQDSTFVYGPKVNHIVLLRRTQ